MLTVSYYQGLISGFTIDGEDCDYLLEALYCVKQSDLENMAYPIKKLVEMLLANFADTKNV